MSLSGSISFSLNSCVSVSAACSSQRLFINSYVQPSLVRGISILAILVFSPERLDFIQWLSSLVAHPGTGGYRLGPGLRPGQRGQLRRRDLGAIWKAGRPSGLAPFDHPTTTVTKKTLLQAIGWRLEQGQQVFFKIWVLQGKKGRPARWPEARPKPGSSTGSQSRRKSRLLTCPATSLCIEGTTWE